MKPLATRILVATAFVFALTASAGMAQGLKIGPHAGFNTDGSDLAFGLGAQFDLPILEREVWGNAAFDFYPFIDNVSITRINANLLFPFGVGNLEFYGGGGLLMQFSSFDLPENFGGDESDTDIALAVKAGWLIGSRADGYRPFVELEQAIGAGSDLGVRAGVYIAIGGK